MTVIPVLKVRKDTAESSTEDVHSLCVIVNFFRYPVRPEILAWIWLHQKIVAFLFNHKAYIIRASNLTEGIDVNIYPSFPEIKRNICLVHFFSLSLAASLLRHISAFVKSNNIMIFLFADTRLPCAL